MTPCRNVCRRFLLPFTLVVILIGVSVGMFVRFTGVGNTMFPAYIVAHLMRDTIVLRSSAFQDGEGIPPTFTVDQDNVSPPLVWSNVPETAKSLVLLVEDPDAADAPWVHWIVYDIPPTFRGLPEHVAPSKEVVEVSPRGTADPEPIYQGANMFGTIGYQGPEPPVGTGPHRYFIRLYALDGVLGQFPSAPTRDTMLTEIFTKHSVVAKGTLMGTYERVE